MAVLEQVKEQLISPWITVSRDQGEKKAAAATEELKLAAQQMVRDDRFRLVGTIVAAVVTIYVLGLATYLIANGHDAEGLWMMSAVLVVAGSGGVAFGFARRADKD